MAAGFGLGKSSLMVFTWALFACGGGTLDPGVGRGSGEPDVRDAGAERDGHEGAAEGDGTDDGDGHADDPDAASPVGDGDGEPSDGDAGSEGPPNRKRCKRGVGYGYHSAADMTALSPAVSWWYNWASVPDEGAASVFRELDVEYVPMLWNGSFDVDEVAARIPEGSEVLLGFNEPNFFAQANMTPEEAAARWPAVEEIAARRGLAIASPALNYCGGGCNQTDPFAYLDAFFAACQGCRVDYIAAHWYACSGEALAWYLGEMARYGKPIWLTEFACGDDADRSLAVQKRYMTEAVAILEADPNVARYAWFAGRTDAIPNVDLLGESGRLTELGELYLSLPAADGCAP